LEHVVPVERERAVRKYRLWWVGACVAAATALSSRPGLAAEREDQCRVARTYIEAYARRELPRLRGHLATEPDHLFGDYPFVGTPKLSRPKVDGRQAVVEFAGVSRQEGVPSRGGLLCYRDKGTWKVRQVLFYDKQPQSAQLPKRSITDADRRQEPTLSALGASFLNAWERGDTPTLLANWYDWSKRNDRPITRLQVRRLEVDVAAKTPQEAIATYRVTLTYKWGLLSYSMDTAGGLFLVREGAEWKVRGNLMVFRF
jgi:hypothetical protein